MCWVWCKWGEIREEELRMILISGSGSWSLTWIIQLGKNLGARFVLFGAGYIWDIWDKVKEKDKYANLDLFACVYFNVIWLKCFPHGSAGKDSACSVGDLGLIPGLWRYLGEGNSYPLQYSGVVNSMDCIVDGVTKSQTQLSDFHTHTHTHIHVIECTYLRRTITGEE